MATLFAKPKVSDDLAKLKAIDRALAVIEFDLDGKILSANSNFLSAVGYSLEEIQGRHHSMFVDPGEREGQPYRDFWEALRRGELQRKQFRRIGKGGREIWIEASYNPLLDQQGRPYRVVKYATDITNARMEVADLRGQADAIRRSQAVIEFTLEGVIITANSNFLDTVGYSLH